MNGKFIWRKSALSVNNSYDKSQLDSLVIPSLNKASFLRNNTFFCMIEGFQQPEFTVQGICSLI